MTPVCRAVPPNLSFQRPFAVLGSVAALGVLGCSDPLPPDPEAAVAISRQLAESPEGMEMGVCPEQHGALTFPSQPPLNFNSTTPESTVETMELIKGGVRCTIAGSDGNYTGTIEIEQREVGGVGYFRLESIAVQNGFSTSNAARLAWNYQGSTYSGNCSINVDARPATEEHDGFYIEAGMAKVTFACDPFVNGDNQACRAAGTVFVMNCRKK